MEQLTRVQKEFLHMTACFIRDRKYEGEEVSDLPALIELAVSHKLSPAVFEVLGSAVSKEVQIQSPEWKAWRSSVVREFVFQTQRTEGFLAVYRALEAAGVRTLVVKGIICRSLYSKPDDRISSDEDILVRAEDARACDKVLQEQGFLRSELDFDRLPHEVDYRNPMNGVYLEVHYSLFEEGSELFGHLNELFWDVFEKSVYVEVNDNRVWTLDPTGHLLYLICHSYKHFLHSGFGIRQVCDMVMMAEKWQEEIDWKRLKKELEALHMLKFFEGILKIGTGWLEMDDRIYGKLDLEAEQKRIGECREKTADLVLDILLGGIYGSRTSERLHSANVTLAAAEKKSGLKRSLFPGREYMEGQYPFVKKSVLLLPAAWILRICRYASSKGKADNSMEVGRQRIELLKKYDVIR